MITLEEGFFQLGCVVTATSFGIYFDSSAIAIGINGIGVMIFFGAKAWLVKK